MLSNLHWGDVLLHIVNMVILFVIVRFLVYRPMRRFMNARSERIAASLEEAKNAREEAGILHTQAGAIIADAESSARVKALGITNAASESARAIAESARTEGRAILENARAQAQAEHDRAMAALRNEVIDLAAEMAAKILQQGTDGGDLP